MSHDLAPAVEAALEQAADAMFLEAAPDDLPLADDCPGLHAEMVKQSAAAVTAFLRRVPATTTAGQMLLALTRRR